MNSIIAGTIEEPGLGSASTHGAAAGLQNSARGARRGLRKQVGIPLA